MRASCSTCYKTSRTRTSQGELVCWVVQKLCAKVIFEVQNGVSEQVLWHNFSTIDRMTVSDGSKYIYASRYTCRDLIPRWVIRIAFTVNGNVVFRWFYKTLLQRQYEGRRPPCYWAQKCALDVLEYGQEPQQVAERVFATLRGQTNKCMPILETFSKYQNRLFCCGCNQFTKSKCWRFTSVCVRSRHTVCNLVTHSTIKIEVRACNRVVFARILGTNDVVHV